MKANNEAKNTLNEDEATAPADNEVNGDELDANESEIEHGVLVKLLERERERTEDLTDQLQRERAELINYRRRKEQEHEQVRTRATENLLRKILPMVDDFHRAFKSLPAEAEGDSWVQGFRLIETNLRKALESEGVTVMQSIGKPFDPARHEAVAFDEATTGEHMVVEEFQRGYFIHDRVLRPAMVKVGSLATESGTDA